MISSSLCASVPSCLRAYERFVPSGFIGIKLSVPVSEKISEAQIALLDHEQFNGQIELSHLIERLRVRMDREAIVQVQIAESHLPELAYCSAGSNASETPRTKKPTADNQRFLPRVIRPLKLLNQPQEIDVIVTPSHDLDGQPVSFSADGQLHRLSHALGPERIAGRWWAGHDKTRDYFDVEDSTGKRYWIFRVLQTARWYLHGCFE